MCAAWVPGDLTLLGWLTARFRSSSRAGDMAPSVVCIETGVDCNKVDAHLVITARTHTYTRHTLFTYWRWG